MFFTLPTFLLSLVLSILASPVPLDVDATHTTTLSPRINHEGRGTFFFVGRGPFAQRVMIHEYLGLAWPWKLWRVE